MKIPFLPRSQVPNLELEDAAFDAAYELGEFDYGEGATDDFDDAEGHGEYRTEAEARLDDAEGHGEYRTEAEARAIELDDAEGHGEYRTEAVARLDDAEGHGEYRTEAEARLDDAEGHGEYRTEAEAGAIELGEARKGIFSTEPGLETTVPDDDYLREPNDDVSADEFADEMDRLRSHASSEQRSAWAYLGLLTGLFCALVIFGYGCSDQRGAEVANGQPGDLTAAEQPAQIVFRVDGDIVTLQGAVPDEAAKGQLLSRAQSSYGAENVIDELTVDPGTTFEEGTIRVVGSAAFNDDRPQILQEAISIDFGLANRGFEVRFVETVLAPVNAEAALADGRVMLSGVLPDVQSVADLEAVANEVWGEANVDGASLTVGDTTWTEGLVRLTGSVLSNDQRIATFVALVPERIGALVTVDTSGLTTIDITEQLNTIQMAIDDLVAANPIQFEPLSAEIESSSDQTLVGVAELVAQLPSTPFEVVGHTDSVGNDQENLLLSQDRAKAVVARLVELGVSADRMSSRGEGETKPIADNDTDEGKAANRRIEFVLVGASN